MPEINLGPTGHTDSMHDEAMGVPVGQETAAPTPSQEGGTGDAPGISLPETASAESGVKTTVVEPAAAAPEVSSQPEGMTAEEFLELSEEIAKMWPSINPRLRSAIEKVFKMLTKTQKNFSSEQTPGSSSL